MLCFDAWNLQFSHTVFFCGVKLSKRSTPPPPNFRSPGEVLRMWLRIGDLRSKLRLSSWSLGFAGSTPGFLADLVRIWHRLDVLQDPFLFLTLPLPRLKRRGPQIDHRCRRSFLKWKSGGRRVHIEAVDLPGPQWDRCKAGMRASIYLGCNAGKTILDGASHPLCTVQMIMLTTCRIFSPCFHDCYVPKPSILSQGFVPGSVFRAR